MIEKYIDMKRSINHKKAPLPAGLFCSNNGHSEPFEARSEKETATTVTLSPSKCEQQIVSDKMVILSLSKYDQPTGKTRLYRARTIVESKRNELV